ncbi:unnamed protein product, partial [Prorocentrum cordatum]
ITSPTSTSLTSCAVAVAAWPRAWCTGAPSKPTRHHGPRLHGPAATKAGERARYRRSCWRCKSRCALSRRNPSLRRPSLPRRGWTCWGASLRSGLVSTRLRFASWWSSGRRSRPSCARSSSRRSRLRSGSRLPVSKSPRSSSKPPGSRTPARPSRRSWWPCRRRSQRRMPRSPSLASSCSSSRASWPCSVGHCRSRPRGLLAPSLAPTRAAGRCPSWS